jgi:hypothetical protein
MTIYEITPDNLRQITETSFHAAGVFEADLQRLLRSQIDIISPDTLVIAEEFGEWEDSRRRIDLLGLDKNADLVVIELKRTEDGGHMELQAIRYAAMVSAMTFDKVVEVYAAYLSRNGSTADAQTAILEFLEWEEPDEDHFAQDVRIVLASAEFSKELTTAVMWLNERDLDIRCIKVKPYADNGRVLLDVHQVIPLPEAADYLVKIKENEGRERETRKEQTEAGDYWSFWTELLARARDKTDLHARTSSSKEYYVGTQIRNGLTLGYVVPRRKPASVQLYFGGGNKEKNKRFFDQLFAEKDHIEGRFGGPLVWERLDDKVACRIKAETDVPFGEQNTWPQLQDTLIDMMIRFEKALRPSLDASER